MGIRFPLVYQNCSTEQAKQHLEEDECEEEAHRQRDKIKRFARFDRGTRKSVFSVAGLGVHSLGHGSRWELGGHGL